jgi:hypothetical protein
MGILAFKSGEAGILSGSMDIVFPAKPHAVKLHIYIDMVRGEMKRIPAPRSNEHPLIINQSRVYVSLIDSDLTARLALAGEISVPICLWTTKLSRSMSTLSGRQGAPHHLYKTSMSIQKDQPATAMRSFRTSLKLERRLA